MYLKFFNLSEYPFSNGCDERYFFESEAHAEALANMYYAIEERKGMVMITGEVGAGKTFLAKILTRRLSEADLVIQIEDPPLTANELLRVIAGGLMGRLVPEADRLTLTEQLKQRLTRLCRHDRVVAVLLDEAQGMGDEALEATRLLWNWQRDGRRLLQIVLIGQPELRSRLAEPKWESLQQRVALSYHLGSMGLRDTAKYILHRRKVASHNGCPLQFTLQAVEAIYAATHGVPRLINTLCDNALLTAYAQGTTRIDTPVIETALREMTSWGDSTPTEPAAPAVEGVYEPELRVRKFSG